ncbi:MAG: hypoxanthine phosphoribosyltransferase [Clostridiaceae bacterium]|jgi:hypoxanthine phosphoribosyltransferase|nr:hypoxanthine phosphoribosyltransferase [Clostridiaceae bacterium]
MKHEAYKVLFAREEIAARVKAVAGEITRDYTGKKLLAVCILRGAVIFTADLIRELDLDVSLDFISVSSYGAGTTSSGEVRVLHDLKEPIEGRDVLIIEDIIDTGLTLSYLREILLARKPASLKIAALLDKPDRRRTDINADYIGFCIPDDFVVGYGLDFDQRFRHLPDICVPLNAEKKK